MSLFDADSFASPFRIVNLVIGALMVILGLYTLLFGSLVIAAEFSIPTQIARYASFLMSFLGRGLFYVFMGALVLSPGPLRVVGGAVIILVGAIYIVLEFTPSIEPPTNMRSDEYGYEAPVGETV
ncbi:COPI associated protein-domain-containing protein [Myxozyma melibiosi]|uniref:COPI associated protein-domain-containing protein n=1 Tax=Myxozyma melibiosi TaxID=54550 RepID=A0ABR1EZW1_9ASCO